MKNKTRLTIALFLVCTCRSHSQKKIVLLFDDNKPASYTIHIAKTTWQSDSSGTITLTVNELKKYANFTDSFKLKGRFFSALYTQALYYNKNAKKADINIDFNSGLTYQIFSKNYNVFYIRRNIQEFDDK